MDNTAFTFVTTKEKVLDGIATVKANSGEIRSLEISEDSVSAVFAVSGVKGTIVFFCAKGQLTVKVYDKPFLASWDMIEEKLDEFFQ